MHGSLILQSAWRPHLCREKREAEKYKKKFCKCIIALYWFKHLYIYTCSHTYHDHTVGIHILCRYKSCNKWLIIYQFAYNMLHIKGLSLPLVTSNQVIWKELKYSLKNPNGNCDISFLSIYERWQKDEYLMRR